MAELTLKQRVYYQPAIARNQQVIQQLHVNHRPLVYKEWDLDVIENACDAVNKKGFSQRRAAEEYGIPRITLGDYYRGRTLAGAKSGPRKYLTDAEEAELVWFILKMCNSWLFQVKGLDVIFMVQRMCNQKGLNVAVTHGWWEGFCRRHPELEFQQSCHWQGLKLQTLK